MAVRKAKLRTSRTQNYLRSKQDKQLEPLCKRRHLPESVETRGPPRKSARLGERQVNQEAEYTSRPVRSSSRALTRRQSGKQDQHGPKTTNRQTQKHRTRSRSIKDIGQIETQPKSTSAEAQKNLKQNRSIKDRDTFIRDAKLPKRNDTGDLTPRRNFRRSRFIESWLSSSSWARRDLMDNENLLQTPLDDMPRSPDEVPSSRVDTRSSLPFEPPFTFVPPLKRSEKSAVSVHDIDFRDSLRYRNIYINREDPPVELTRRAMRIITRPRTSPEIDDATAQELRATTRKLEEAGEEAIIQQLVPYVIPATDWVSGLRLSCNTNQFERSYVTPDKKLRLPFFDVEFKSQAKAGTHFIATNQAANAGSLALQGYLELIRRSFSVDDLDYNEPQFFSLIMDHETARIHVHWLGIDAEDEQFCFHVAGLSRYFLDDLDSLKAVQRAVKNILEYGADERLQTLCEALDAYRQRAIVEKEMAISNGHQALEVPVKAQETQPRRRSTRTQLLSNRRQKKESQLTHQGLRSIVEEDEPEEPQEQLQSERPGQDEPETSRRTRNGQSTIQRRRRQHRTPSSVKPDPNTLHRKSHELWGDRERA
ncbi:hypothetical protein LPUS_05073 [Lasallia pustulata]|uniref:DUF7924 domain-containing protein n=1 Tax=Lasallia pustulata TaxID=136370 RepID=A0A1W5CXX3_9LECA|nr:hypothetical protein LPUS_05073 [Lasallia pustulata]